MGKRSVIFIAALLFAAFASAHQPKLVFEQASSREKPFVISRPEISQAFYGRLKGSPDYFVIDSSVPFRLYLNVLSPAVNGARQDYSVELNASPVIAGGVPWIKFYEPFAGDTYWKGPEFEQDAGPGRYVIRISNPGDEGKYVLAVGKTESFPLRESMKTLFDLPKLKAVYFGKSYLAVFEGIIGKYLLILPLLFAALVFLLIAATKRFILPGR